MVNLQNICLSYNENLILNNINFSINHGEVVALIGENGVGKTTLLKVITGEIPPDSGTVHLHNETVGYVPQSISAEGTVRQFFDASFEPWRIEMALEQVELGDISRNTNVNDLSGGQKARLVLAKVLANEFTPTILLFDEPTNNLDQAGLDWLGNYIRQFRGGVLIVSHDRAFINRVATKVVELSPAGLKQYGGNYDFYKTQKATEQESQLAEYEKYLNEKNRLLKLRAARDDRVQQVSSQRYNKLKDENRMTFRTKKSATQKNTGKQLKALDTRIAHLEKPERLKVTKHYKASINGHIDGHKLLLQFTGVSKSYKKPILNSLDLEIRGSERVSVEGKNGSGKTTLLKLAANLILPDDGEVNRGENIKIGYFSQDVDELDHELTGFDNLAQTGTETTLIYTKARSLGLTESDIKKKVAELSRGQQAKLSFIKLLLNNNHLLILDEPTNHLDIPTRENIESALQQYEGAIIVASHDRYFLDAIKIRRSVKL